MNSHQKLQEYYQLLEDYQHPKQGILPQEFWPTVNHLLEQGILIEKHGSFFFQKREHD